jgi:hypothetical protein
LNYKSLAFFFEKTSLAVTVIAAQPFPELHQGFKWVFFALKSWVNMASCNSLDCFCPMEKMAGGVIKPDAPGDLNIPVRGVPSIVEVVGTADIQTDPRQILG